MRKDLEYDSIMRTQNIGNKQRTVEALRKEKQVTYKGVENQMTSFSIATLEVRN